MSLSDPELERYARHIVLREVGGPGQAALRRARVLVVGAGGLGAPVLLYLAAAGVGTLGVIDDDVVALSNLQRQVIHATPDLGAPKAASAATTVRRLNPNVTVQAHKVRLVADNALALLGDYDIVADGSDNFATRYLVSDACFFAKKPLVTAALGTFDGTLTTIRAFEHGADGKPNPTYRCLFPEPPPPGTVPGAYEAGVLGALAGVLLGLASGLSRWGEALVDPPVQMLRTLPFLGLVPLFILWFGIGISSTVLVVILLVLFPVTINTEAGLRTTSPRLIEMLRSFGATPRQIFLKVSLPSATPFILAGLKLGIGRGLIGVVVAELFGSRAGLGRLISQSADAFNMPELFAGVVVLAATGIALTAGFGWLERKLVPWTQD